MSNGSLRSSEIGGFVQECAEGADLSLLSRKRKQTLFARIFGEQSHQTRITFGRTL